MCNRTEMFMYAELISECSRRLCYCAMKNFISDLNGCRDTSRADRATWCSTRRNQNVCWHRNFECDACFFTAGYSLMWKYFQYHRFGVFSVRCERLTNRTTSRGQLSCTDRHLLTERHRVANWTASMDQLNHTDWPGEPHRIASGTVENIQRCIVLSVLPRRTHLEGANFYF